MNPLNKYTQIKNGDYVVPITEAIDETILEREAFPTGIELFDQAMARGENQGLRDGDLVIISGKSGHGKTLFGLNLIYNMMEQGFPSVIFSYEVIIENVYEKLKQMGMHDFPAIYTPKQLLTGNLEWVEQKMLEAKEKYFAKIALIDHVDFLTPKDIKTDDNRRNEISNIVTELKNFARDNEYIIILICHIIKTRERRIVNEDLADSRALVNIPDYIILVGREINEEGVAFGNTGIAKLTKNRFNGQTTAIKYEVFNNKIISYSTLGD